MEKFDRFLSGGNMDITDWIFDMDGTLYSPIDAVWDILIAEMKRHFIENLGLNVTWSLEEQNQLKTKWNTKQTTVAYLHEFDLDFEEIIQVTHLSVVDELPVQTRLGTEIIQSLPGNKWVLTNSPEKFAYAMLRKLQLDHLFTGVFGIRDDFRHAKPEHRSFTRVPISSRVVIIDDWHKNLIVPHKLGWTTVLFPEINHPGPIELPSYVNLKITSLSQLTSLL